MSQAKRFDPVERLDRAVDAFWQNGFEASGMQALCKAMGLFPGSLYATYGDKRQLFLKAIERYIAQCSQQALNTLRRDPSGLGAIRAYFEWMPIREARAGTMKEAINRSFHFGDLASLHMVETRLLARVEQMEFADIPKTADGRPDLDAFEAQRQDPSRDLLGEPQRRWLGEAMRQSKAAGRPWQILGNQVIMARVKGPNIEQMVPPAQLAQMVSGLPDDVRPQVETAIQLFRLGLPFNLDSWDGYPAGRERLYETMKQAGVEPIVLAGDSHAFWVNELYDNGGERRAVEFGTSAISSPSPGDHVGGLPLGLALQAANPEVKFCDQSAKGFVLLTLERDQAVGELRTVSTILAKPYENRTLKRYRLARTETGLGPLEDVTAPA